MTARRPEIPGQSEIWPAPQVPPKPRTVAKITTPKWSKYGAVRPHPCDFCKLNQRDDPRIEQLAQVRFTQ